MKGRAQVTGSGWVNQGSEAWKENALEGQKLKRVSAAGEGQPDPVVNGLAGGIRLRSEVKLAEPVGSPVEAQGDREACFRAREKGAHSRQGNQATA